MISPQKENGYTAIANEIMEALSKYRIPGEQMQCLLFIIRKTYGFNKVWDTISNSQFTKATGLKKSSVCRALNKLINKNIVYKKANSYVPSYSFNKQYKSWIVLAKKITVSKKVNKCLQKSKSELAKKRPTKDTLTKDTLTKEKTNIPYKEIIEYLNQKAATNYRHTTKETQNCIKARFNAGFNLDNFKTVMDKKEDWLTDSKMCRYYRPITLFGTKFESYLNETQKQEEYGDF